MARYLISFPDGAMSHIPDADWPAVGEDSHAVARAAQAAGVFVYGRGIFHDTTVTVVGTDGAVTDDAYPGLDQPIGGFSIIDVPSRDEALRWAAQFAVACRCAQEVRELMDDPEEAP